MQLTYKKIKFALLTTIATIFTYTIYLIPVVKLQLKYRKIPRGKGKHV